MTDFCDFIPDDPSCIDDISGGDDNGGIDDGGNTEIDDGSNVCVGDDCDTNGENEVWKRELMTWNKFEKKADEHFDPMTGNFAYLSVSFLFAYDYLKKALD